MRYIILFAVLAISMNAPAALLFYDDFEQDALWSEPASWELGHDGSTTAEVVADPRDASNNVLLSSDKASRESRHRYGGSIYVVGDADWGDYIAEWDMMFPDNHYMGFVYRFQNPDEYYLGNRQQDGREYHFHRPEPPRWNNLIGRGQVPTQPMVWYRAQLTLEADAFTFKLKEREDKTSFQQLAPTVEGSDSTIKTGKFGTQGRIYLDNLVIGHTLADLLVSVEARDKMSTTWSVIKRRYSSKSSPTGGTP